MSTTFTDSDYPGLYQAADSAAISAQNAYFRCLSWFLCLLVLGSISNIVSAGSTVGSFMAAILFFGALFFSGLLAWKRYDRSWYGARAVAESVKTIAWRFAMRAEPYHIDDQHAKEQFLVVLDEILQENQHVTKELCDESASFDAISNMMMQIRALSLQERLDLYTAQRVQDQGGWYLRKARLNKLGSVKWFIGIVALNALAIGCAVLRVVCLHCMYIPTDVFAVAAASAVSWLQAKRFTELSTSYALTAHEINISRARSGMVQSEDDFSQFVSDTENAFSREHTQWAARRNSMCRTR